MAFLCFSVALFIFVISVDHIVDCMEILASRFLVGRKPHTPRELRIIEKCRKIRGDK